MVNSLLSYFVLPHNLFYINLYPFHSQFDWFRFVDFFTVNPITEKTINRYEELEIDGLWTHDFIKTITKNYLVEHYLATREHTKER